MSSVNGQSAVLAFDLLAVALGLDAVQRVVEAQPAVRLGDRDLVHLALRGLEGDRPERRALAAVDVRVGRRGRGGGREEQAGQ